MARRIIYSASLERLPSRPDNSNQNQDWARRARKGLDYTDYDFGGTWRFSEEGTYPGIQLQNEDEGSSLKLLATCARNDTIGRKRYVINIKEG